MECWTTRTTQGRFGQLAAWRILRNVIPVSKTEFIKKVKSKENKREKEREGERSEKSKVEKDRKTERQNEEKRDRDNKRE